MPRTATFGLLLLVVILVAPALSAGYAVFAKGPTPAPADSTEVIADHSSHPAILLPVGQGPSVSSSLSTRTSYNWSGYVISSGAGSVTDVNGSWVVPTVSCPPSSNSYSAFWVGIDGWSDGTVEQTGTDSDCQGGLPTYYAWFEFYPAEAALVSGVTVGAGDVISASVSCQASGLECTVSITDFTTGQTSSYTQAFGPGSGPQMTSADWIAEAPSMSSGGILPLADFGTVQFGQDSTGVAPSNSATVAGASGPIGSFGPAVVEVFMLDSDGSAQAQPSELSADGTSFSVAWSSGSRAVVPADSALSAGVITPVRPTIESGESIQLTANPSGGVPPYDIVWYSAASAGNCSDSDASVSTGSTYSPSPTVDTYYCYTVTDSAYPPVSANSSADLVMVDSALDYPAILVSSGIIGIGQSALISTVETFAGGTPPYTCQWLEEPPSAANFSYLGSPFREGCEPFSNPSASTGALSISGTWAFELQVTDALGTKVVSPSETLSVSDVTGPALTLSCTPSPVVVGSATDCEATVHGSSSAPTGSIAWSSSAPGKFSSTSCKLSDGTCSVKFTPTSAGALVGFLASYWGDSSNNPSAEAYVLNVTVRASETTVSCTRAGVPAASSKTVTCKAKVIGDSPTGTVTWSQGGTGSVSFSSIPVTCTLSKGTCSVTMTGEAAGDLNVTASYGGDQNNAASYAAASLTIAKAKTTLSISCAQKSLVNGNSTTCAASVAGPYPSQTGTITWSEEAGSGSVSSMPVTCSLSAGSCLVNVTASATGKVTILAVYSGDSNNKGSSRTERLTIKKAPAPITTAPVQSATGLEWWFNFDITWTLGQATPSASAPPRSIWAS